MNKKLATIGTSVAVLTLSALPAFAQTAPAEGIDILEIVQDNFSVIAPLAAIGFVVAGVMLVRVTLRSVGWVFSAIR